MKNICGECGMKTDKLYTQCVNCSSYKIVSPLDNLTINNPQGIAIGLDTNRILSDKTRKDGIRIIKYFYRYYSNGHSAFNGWIYKDGWAAWNGSKWFHGNIRKEALEKLNEQ